MNKIKLFYDVVKTMRDKEVFNGSLEVNGKKDQMDCFSFTNEFERNITTGQVKFKIKTGLDCDGKQMKHESSSEFNMQNGCGGMHRHQHYANFKHRFHSQGCPGESDCCGGDVFKTKLSGLMFILRLIDELKVEELENNALALSLQIDELPEGLGNHIQGRFQHRMSVDEGGSHPHHSCMKALLALEKPQIVVNIKLDQNRAVEKVVITAAGKQKSESDTLHEVSFKAELNLNW
ncbi:MAG: hypothetical protein VB084_02980 [Syntrophomonadaceae bacterium]|nr:hypothetical protein [Syntrophomonadaceae bacterium]